MWLCSFQCRQLEVYACARDVNWRFVSNHLAGAVQGIQLHMGKEELDWVDWDQCEQEIMLPVIQVMLQSGCPPQTPVRPIGGTKIGTSACIWLCHVQLLNMSTAHRAIALCMHEPA